MSEEDGQKEFSKLSLGGSKLNPFASGFTPNLNAPSFVPGASSAFQMDFSTPETVPVAAPAEPKPKVVKKPAEQQASTESLNEKKSKETPKKETKGVPLPSVQTVELTAEEKAMEEEFFQKEKEHLNIIFIGHVDAGKSTMGGQLLYLTGMVDQRTLEKYEREAKEQNRESWYFSWALDTNAEERAKGKTVEVGRAVFETEKRKFTILDAPGHKSYVPNMIGGASQADIAVLVVSARKGEFETGFERGGQTGEHAMLAKMAGIKRLVVAINKMDDPTVQWSQERYDEIVNKLVPFLKKNGFNPKTDLNFMPVSGFTGANLKEPLKQSQCSWYQGPTLLGFLDTVTGVDRKLDAPFMMPLNDKYKDMGTIVSGKIESGRLRTGAKVLGMPAKKVIEIQTIFTEMDDEVPFAHCGDNVRLKLKGIEEEEIHSGFVLCDPQSPIHTVTRFEAQLVILDIASIISAGYSCVLHVHSCVEEVTIDALLNLIDRKSGRRSKKPPPFVKKGQVVNARLEVKGLPICLETYQDYPVLGRFTLRDENQTVAMGKVLKLIED